MTNYFWLDCMAKIELKWMTSYIDMDYWCDLYMPTEMEFLANELYTLDTYQLSVIERMIK